jgi:hypothetical protein
MPVATYLRRKRERPYFDSVICAVTQNTHAGMSPVSPGLKINESKVDLAVDGKWLTIER